MDLEILQKATKMVLCAQRDPKLLTTLTTSNLDRVRSQQALLTENAENGSYVLSGIDLSV